MAGDFCILCFTFHGGDSIIQTDRGVFLPAQSLHRHCRGHQPGDPGGFEPPLRVRWKPGGWRVANLATRWHEVPLAPPLGELLSECEAEGVSFDGWYTPWLSTAPCSRAYRLKVCTTWLPPGGSCQTALRNRLTDEGRRTVGQEMQLDERYMFQIVPFNREIQNF